MEEEKEEETVCRYEEVSNNDLAPVFQRVDNAIQRISIGKTNYAIRWIVLSTL